MMSSSSATYRGISTNSVIPDAISIILATPAFFNGLSELSQKRYKDALVSESAFFLFIGLLFVLPLAVAERTLGTPCSVPGLSEHPSAFLGLTLHLEAVPVGDLLFLHLPFRRTFRRTAGR